MDLQHTQLVSGHTAVTVRINIRNALTTKSPSAGW